MNPKRSYPPEYDHTNHSIGYCVPGWNKRTISVCGDLSPVKGNWQQRDSGPSAKKLVYNNVIGADPDGECEDAEERRDEAREPVPTEGTSKDNEEVFVTGDPPAVALRWVGF